MECFDLTSGESVWRIRTGKGEAHQFLEISGSCVLVLEGNNHILAFDLDSGELRWLTRLRSRGCWGPISYGAYLVVLSRNGHLAVLEPELERKVWEGSIGGHHQQPPAAGFGCLAAVSNYEGLKLFKINPFYEEGSPCPMS